MGFGSGLSQITGQISNFTKEVLTERAEETYDHAAQLKISHSRIKFLEERCSNQVVELDRLKQINSELHEKLQSTELQLINLSNDYRNKLDDSTNEIKRLKQEHNDYLDQQSKNFLNSFSQPASISNKSNLALISDKFGHDEHDFDDVISAQNELNGLRKELQKSEAECHHWRKIAERSQKTDSVDSELDSLKTTNIKQKEKIKKLQEELSNAIDSLQAERATLQELHSQKLLQLKHQHAEEIEKVKKQLSSLNSKENLETSVLSLQNEVIRLKQNLTKAELEKKEVVTQNEALQQSLLDGVSLSSINSLNPQSSNSPNLSRDYEENPSESLILDLSENTVQKQRLEEKVIILQNQIDSLEKDRNLFEELQADWEAEKEALQKTVIDLRNILKVDRNAQSSHYPDVGERSVEG